MAAFSIANMSDINLSNGLYNTPRVTYPPNPVNLSRSNVSISLFQNATKPRRFRSATPTRFVETKSVKQVDTF